MHRSRWASTESVEDQTVLYYTETFNLRQGSRQPGDTLDLITPADQRTVSIRDLGVYVGAATTIPHLPDLRVSANFRTDFPNQFDPQYSLRAAASYRWSRALVTKLVAGRAFQAPSAQLLYALGGASGTGNIIGARTAAGHDVGVQTVSSAELITNASLFDYVALDVAAYWQRVEDRIEFTQITNAFVPENKGRDESVGFEIAARTSSDPVRAYASFNTQFSIENPSSTQRGISYQAPSLAPLYTFIAGLTARFRKVHMMGNVNARVVGPRGGSQSNILDNNRNFYQLDPYAIIDVTLGSVDLFLLSDEDATRIQAGIRNVLDVHYSNPGFTGFDIPGLGRTYFVELSQRL